MPEPLSPYASLRAAVYDLYYETISRYPAPYAPGIEPAGDPPYRLGEYLVYQGYLSSRELRLALQESQGVGGGKPTPLGFILVTRYRVPVRVLTMTLLLQTFDRLVYAPNQPRFLGEELLRKEALTPEQLALVLEEQVAHYAVGKWSRIGDLIANRGWLEAEMLSTMVREMRAVPSESVTAQTQTTVPDLELDLATIMALLRSNQQQSTQAALRTVAQ